MEDVDRYLRLSGWTEFDGSWCDWLDDEKTGARKVCNTSQARCDQLRRDRFLIDHLRENNLRSETEVPAPRLVAFVDGVLMFHAVKVATEVTPEHRTLEMTTVGNVADYDFEEAKRDGREVLIKLSMLSSNMACTFKAVVTDLTVKDTRTDVVLKSVGDEPAVFE